MEMYEVRWDDVVLVHDLHPQYFSTEYALTLKSSRRIAVQHHRAHVASVLAEQGLLETRVVGVSLDGTGFGDDGSIWGGEIFVGSVLDGFERIAHLRTAALPGGDAAARHPVQAAAGFLAQLDEAPDFSSAPFHFPSLYRSSVQLIDKQVRTFSTTSFGRLFDTVAALLGFTRPISFEGQAAIWLEQLARKSSALDDYPFPYADHQLDFRPLINSVAKDRMHGLRVADIARAFQRGVANGLWNAVESVLVDRGLDTVVLSGGVFQNELLLEDLKALLQGRAVQVLTNHVVPPNDGGISLGQAAWAVFGV
jgi:hydrogenase maturation protein HypF